MGVFAGALSCAPIKKQSEVKTSSMFEPQSTITIETAAGRRIILPNACPAENIAAAAAASRIDVRIYNTIVRHIPFVNIRARPAPMPEVTLKVAELDRLGRWGIIPYLARTIGYGAVACAGAAHMMSSPRPRMAAVAIGICAAAYLLPYNKHFVLLNHATDPIYVHALHHLNVRVGDDVTRVIEEHADGRVEELPARQDARYIVAGCGYY